MPASSARPSERTGPSPRRSPPLAPLEPIDAPTEHPVSRRFTYGSWTDAVTTTEPNADEQKRGRHAKRDDPDRHATTPRTRPPTTRRTARTTPRDDGTRRRRNEPGRRADGRGPREDDRRASPHAEEPRQEPADDEVSGRDAGSRRSTARRAAANDPAPSSGGTKPRTAGEEALHPRHRPPPGRRLAAHRRRTGHRPRPRPAAVRPAAASRSPPAPPTPPAAPPHPGSAGGEPWFWPGWVAHDRPRSSRSSSSWWRPSACGCPTSPSW